MTKSVPDWGGAAPSFLNKQGYVQEPWEAPFTPSLVPEEVLINGMGVIGTHENEHVTPDIFQRMLERPEKGPWCVAMIVTQPLAEFILGKNLPSNRRVKRQAVKKYADDMAYDNWTISPSGLVLDSNHALIDGQQRLHACLKSGAAFPTLVWFNWPPQTVEAIDIGVPRSAQDVLRIRGTPLGRDVIQSVRIIRAIEDVSGGQKLIRAGAQLSVAEIARWYERHRLEHIVELVKDTPKILTAARAGLIAGLYMIQDTEHEAFEPFVSKLVLGLGLENMEDPVFMVRQRMISRQAVGMELSALIVKTWNAVAGRRRLKRLSWRKDEPFPHVGA